MSNLPVLKNIIGSPNITPPQQLAAPPSRATATKATATKNTPIRRASRSSILTSGQGAFGNLDILKKKLGAGILIG